MASRTVPLRFRLLTGYAVVLATVIIGYGFLLAGVMALGASPRNIVNNHYISIQAAERMIQAVQEQQNALLRKLLNPDHDLDANLVLADRQFRDWLQQADDSIALIGELDMLETIEQRYDHLQELIIDRTGWVSLYPWETDVVDAFQGVIEVCQQLAEINFNAMLVVSESAHERVQGAVLAAAVAGFGTLLVSLLVALNVARRLVTSLQRIIDGTRRIAQGDYQVQVPRSSTRELDQLGRQFNAMARALQHFNALNLERVLHEQRQSEAVLRSIDDGLVIFGEDVRIRHFNPVAARQLGIGEPRCREHTLGELLAQRGVENNIDAEVDRCFEQSDDREPTALRELQIGSDAGTRHLGYTVLPILGDRGRHREGAVMVIRDITEHKAFDRMRNEFVMRASHELRTPVTGIRMGIGMLAEKAPFPEGSRECELIDTVSEELDRLTELVNELFDLSRLQADQNPLELESVSVGELLEAAVQRFTAEAAEKGVEISLQLGEDLPSIMLDRGRMARVLDNLLGNALRHTGSGGRIRLAASRNHEQLTIEVEDTGSGIDYTHQHRVFEPFVQVDEDSGGAGLGLAICREIVHQHKGRIGLVSAPGRGTTFRLDLPV